MRTPRLLALAVLVPLLAACGSVLPKPPPSPDLYSLTPAPAPATAPKSRLPLQLLVTVPQSTAALDSIRIALTQSPTTLEYYADAAWTDYAPQLLQSMLVETLERSGLFAAVARSSVNLRADETLNSDLRHFEAEIRGGATQARVEIDFKLVRINGEIAAEKDFVATAPASSNAVPAVVEAIDNATHQVFSQVGPWVAASLAPGQGKNR